MQKIQHVYNSISDLQTLHAQSELLSRLKEATNDYSVEVIKAAINQGDFTATQISAILSTKGLTDEEIQTIITSNSLTASQAGTTASTLGLGTAFKGLGISIKNATASMLTFLASNPVGWFMAVAGVIGGSVLVMDYLSKSLDRQKEKLQKVRTAYDDVSKELQSLQEELQSTKDAVSELEAAPNLSWAEQEELDRLREITKELELQKQIKQKEQLTAAEGLFSENKKTFDEEFVNASGSTSISDLEQMLSSNKISVWQLDLENNIPNIIAALHYLREEKQKLTDPNEMEEYDSIIKDLTQSIKTNGLDCLSSLSSYKQNILEIAAVRELTAEEQSFYDYLSSVQKMIYEFYSPAAWNDLEFDSIFDTAGLEKTKEELVSMAKAGTLDENTIKSFTNLNQAISASEFILQDGETALSAFCAQIYSLVPEIEAAAQNMDHLNKSITDSFSSIRSSYSVLTDFQSAMQTGITDSVLRSVADLSDELNVMTAEFYAGIISADDLYTALSDHYMNDLQNYSEAILQKNLMNKEFYIAAGLSNAEVVNQFLNDYNLDISNCKDYNSTKLAIEKQTLGTLAAMWSKYYNAQTQSYTPAMEALGRQAEAAARQGVPDQNNSALLLTRQIGAQVNAYESAMTALNNIVYSGIQSDFEASYNKFTKTSAHTAKAQTDWKNILDKYLALYEAELEAGLSDFNTYLTKSKALLEAYYRDGKLSAKDYWDETKSLYESQLSIYDKVLSAVNRRFDTEIDRINEIIDDIEKQNEALENQKAIYDSALSAIQSFLDSKKELYQNDIDGIESENNSLQKQIDKYDALLGAVSDVFYEKREGLQGELNLIQERIDALQEANDAQQKSIELEKARYELGRAQSQRSKKVFNGTEFIYEADNAAIHDAQDNLSSLELDSAVDALEREKEAIQEIIDSLDILEETWNQIPDAFTKSQNTSAALNLLGSNYKDIILNSDPKLIADIMTGYTSAQQKMEDNTFLIAAIQEKMDNLETLSNKWSEIADIHEKNTNRENAIQLLGQEWESLILEQRQETLDQFRNEYLLIQSQIDDNTALIESYQQKTEYYELLKEQWSSVADAYENSVNDQYAAMILGQNWEADVLNGRINTLNSFREQYTSIQQAIADAAWASANEQIKAAQEAEKAAEGTEGSSENIKISSQTSADTLKQKAETASIQSWIHSQKDTSQASRSKTTIKKPEIKSISKYAAGGVISDKDITPLDYLAESIGEQHIVAVKNNERILTPFQNETFEKLIQSMPSMLDAYHPLKDYSTPKYDFSSIPKNNTINMTIGNINLHEVNDADSLSKAIITYLPGKMLQAMNKRI